MKFKNIKYIFLIYISIIYFQKSEAQYLRNGSFTGTPGANPPENWAVCDEWSEPEVLTSFVPNDNPGSSILPSQGITMLLMKAVGVNFTGDCRPAETRDYISQELQSPLLKGNCYRLEASLNFNNSINFGDVEEPDIAYPLKLQAWGANENCTKTELLFESNAIDNTIWEEFSFVFNIQGNDYSHIYFQVQWDSVNVNNEPYNGMMLLDNLSMSHVGNATETLVHDIYYKLDQVTQLIAMEGERYKWGPETGLSAYDIQSPLMFDYHKQYLSTAYNCHQCPIYEIHNIIINCDTLYPFKNTKTHTVYFKPGKEITASPGASYDWVPNENLSAFDVQSPVLTGYDDQFNVSVTDRFGCVSEEEFNVVLNCDTIYPQANMVVLDTLIESGSQVELTPEWGEIEGTWNPPVNLSCTDCREPVASPENSVVYQANLTDNFGCAHTELFAIDVMLEIPNVITPNLDGYNDRFEILGLPDGASLNVFDKNGSHLFSAKPYNSNSWWSGTDNRDRLLETGTYWYVLELPGNEEVYKGFVFIKR